jgi:hypothetical protein
MGRKLEKMASGTQGKKTFQEEKCDRQNISNINNTTYLFFPLKEVK